VLTTEKMAVLAPIPRASAATAASVNDAFHGLWPLLRRPAAAARGQLASDAARRETQHGDADLSTTARAGGNGSRYYPSADIQHAWHWAKTGDSAFGRIVRTALAGSLMAGLTPEDWNDVRRIYAEGIATGNATLETEPPAWEEGDRSHRADSRLVESLPEGRLRRQKTRLTRLKSTFTVALRCAAIAPACFSSLFPRFPCTALAGQLLRFGWRPSLPSQEINYEACTRISGSSSDVLGCEARKRRHVHVDCRQR
jgi:hypothetical protein